MANDRTKNKPLLAKVETTSGQDASPAVGAEEPRQDLEFEVIRTNDIGASLDSRAPIVGGGFIGMTLTPLLECAGAYLGQTAVRFNTDTMGYGAEAIRRRGDQEKGPRIRGRCRRDRRRGRWRWREGPSTSRRAGRFRSATDTRR